MAFTLSEREQQLLAQRAARRQQEAATKAANSQLAEKAANYKATTTTDSNPFTAFLDDTVGALGRTLGNIAGAGGTAIQKVLTGEMGLEKELDDLYSKGLETGDYSELANKLNNLGDFERGALTNISTSKLKKWNNATDKAVTGQLNENAGDALKGASTLAQAIPAGGTLSAVASVPAKGSKLLGSANKVLSGYSKVARGLGNAMKTPAGSVVTNLLGGAAQGAGDEFSKGKDADWQKAIGRAITGAVAEGATLGAAKGIGKVAGKVSDGVVGKAANAIANPNTILSQAARSATEGAIGGGISAAGNTLAEGASLEEALGQLGSGALGGALAGGTLGGGSALLSKGLRSGARKLGKDVKTVASDKKQGSRTLQNNTMMDSEVGNGREISVSVNPTQEISAIRDTLSGESNQMPSPAKTGKQIKNERLATNEIIQQFGSVSAPVQRMTKPSETFPKLTKMTGLTDGDDIRAAVNAVTGRDGVVSKIIRDAAQGAGVIDVSDVNEIVRKLPKAQRTKIKGILDYIIDSTPSTVTGGKNGVDAIQLERSIQQMAADARGQGGQYKIGNHSIDKITSDNLEEAAKLIGQRLDDAAASSDSITQAVLNSSEGLENLRQMFPNNKEWNKYLDDIVNAKSISELRSLIKAPTRASIYIDNADDQAFTFGARMAGNVNIPSSAKTATGMALDATATKMRQSTPVRVAMNNYYQGRANDAGVLKSAGNAVLFGRAAQGSATPKASAQIPTWLDAMMRQTTAANQGSNAVNNMREQENRAIDQDIASVLSNYASQGYDINDLVMPQQISDQSAANILGQVSTTPLSEATGLGGYTPSAGAAQTNPFATQLDSIAGAMQNALSAGDIASYAELADLYSTIAGLVPETTSTAPQLNATQQKTVIGLQNAYDSLQSLERLFSEAGGGQGGIGGTLATVSGGLSNLFGGSDPVATYNSQATALINTLKDAIGKTDAANTDPEVQRLMAMIPNVTDSPQDAQNKLNNLRNYIETTYQNTMGTYGGNYSLY